MNQDIIKISDGNYDQITEYLCRSNFKRIFVVCGSSFYRLPIGKYIISLEQTNDYIIDVFSDFAPNPEYNSIVSGIIEFNKNKYDVILAAGGGSAIDVAKCIKLYANMDHTKNYLHQEVIPNNIPLISLPTTAGSGSEATRYAVVYYNGDKQSICHESSIPSTVIFDSTVLDSLPDYHKKSTMLDAMCHAIEAFWSVNSNDESKEYSRKAINLILKNYRGYLEGYSEHNDKMLEAAYWAGRAINITQTTAGHAMCYKLTTKYGVAHGFAAAKCVGALWPYMCLNIERCQDLRGSMYLKEMFLELAELFGARECLSGANNFTKILKELDVPVVVAESEEDFDILKSSVNPVRLKNNPVVLDYVGFEEIYRQIVRG